ncbi:MAG: GTPase HflX [Brucellaceae bacterium]|nr:GTPase HflX [Brucellaceae bacterium]
MSEPAGGQGAHQDSGLIDHTRQPTKAVVVSLLDKPQRAKAADKKAAEPVAIDPQARLDEIVGLAEAIDLDVCATVQLTLGKIVPATLIGTGRVAEIGTLVEEGEAELVVVDHWLSPVQQRNLEKAWNAKVLDRTGLILEIFGRRARTKEGALQVELAHLEYQRGRLVRSWTHLERQRGGGGFMGGPGETQIEADRRLLQNRITALKRELERVRRTRTLHRAKRKKVPHPVVAIVGYTNAGKSTLFNRLTGAEVLARDMLFATLDPTLRRLKLPHGTDIILSDTVGFISDLPTHLVAAFRATLEEVVEAELVVHVRDMSNPDNEAQRANVLGILEDLGVETTGDHILEVWNKVDRLGAEARERLEADAGRLRDTPPVLVSALTGEGLDGLMKVIEGRVAGAMEALRLHLTPDRLGRLSWIYDHAEVTERQDNEDGSVDLAVNAPRALHRALTALMH